MRWLGMNDTNSRIVGPPARPDAHETHVTNVWSGGSPDEELIALSPEMAEAILNWTKLARSGSRLNHPDGPSVMWKEACEDLLGMADRLLAIGENDD